MQASQRRQLFLMLADMIQLRQGSGNMPQINQFTTNAHIQQVSD